MHTGFLKITICHRVILVPFSCAYAFFIFTLYSFFWILCCYDHGCLITGFLSLPLHDQMNLLQCTWLDILCFNEAFRSVPYNGTIVYADDFKCSELESKRLGIPTELDNVSRRLVLKMSRLALSREEYIFLKTILLLNPGSLQYFDYTFPASSIHFGAWW